MNIVTNLRILSIVILPLIFLFSLNSDAQDANTVLLYTFETGEGDVAKDLSGNGNDGIIKGAEWSDGKVRKGLAFGGNASQNFIELPDSESLDIVEALTIEMWIFLNSAPTAGGVGATKESTYKMGPRSDQKVLLRMTTTTQPWGNAVVFSNKELSLNQWVHIAVTYDANSGDGKIYIDGELDNDGNIGGDIVPNDRLLWLGRGASPFLDGRMDEVRISNIERTQKEIQQLMNIGIEGVLSVTPRDKLTTSWGKLKSNFAH